MRERKYNNIPNAKKARPVQAARQSLHGEQWRPYRPQPAVGQTAAAAAFVYYRGRVRAYTMVEWW